MSTLRELLAQAGFHGQGLDTAVAVALAESGGNPNAHNGNVGTGDNSYGLFQINMLGAMGPDRMKTFGLSSYDQLYDPATNARAAYIISDGGQNWEPWSTYKTGAYQQYLGENPATDLGSSTPAGTAQSYDAIDAGAPLSGTPADHDAIAREWEQVLGAHPAAPMQTDNTALDQFLHAAIAQRGDAYVFGAKGAPGDLNPTAFDCSGLTKWAAQQAGYELPDGAAYQYLALKAQGALIPVEQAIHTPGALLFHFAVEPQGGSEPAIAHVAISLGNGKTIEAADPADGVTEFSAGGGRFNYAAVIPGISDGTTAASASVTDHLDGLSPTSGQFDPSAGDPGFSDKWASVLGSGHGTDPGLHGDGSLDPAHDVGGHDLGLH